MSNIIVSKISKMIIVGLDVKTWTTMDYNIIKVLSVFNFLCLYVIRTPARHLLHKLVQLHLSDHFHEKINNVQYQRIQRHNCVKNKVVNLCILHCCARQFQKNYTFKKHHQNTKQSSFKKYVSDTIEYL